MFVAAWCRGCRCCWRRHRICRAQAGEKGNRSFQPILYVAAGAAVIGLVVLAGHPELIYYTLIVAGAYTFVRLIAAYFHSAPVAAAVALRAHPQAGRLAADDGGRRRGAGRGAVDPAGRTAAAELPRGSASLEQVLAGRGLPPC